MQDDQDDSRSAPTIAPDAVRDTEEPGPDIDRSSTMPPGIADAEAELALKTMLPAAPAALELGRAPKTLEDSYLDRAIRVVASAGARLAEDRDERRVQHEAVLAAIHRSDENQSKNYALLREEIVRLKKSDLEQDAKIATLRLEVAAMRDQLAQAMVRLDDFERRLPDDAAASTATPQGA